MLCVVLVFSLSCKELIEKSISFLFLYIIFFENNVIIILDMREKE